MGYALHNQVISFKIQVKRRATSRFRRLPLLVTEKYAGYLYICKTIACCRGPLPKRSIPGLCKWCLFLSLVLFEHVASFDSLFQVFFTALFCAWPAPNLHVLCHVLVWETFFGCSLFCWLRPKTKRQEVSRFSFCAWSAWKNIPYIVNIV